MGAEWLGKNAAAIATTTDLSGDLAAHARLTLVRLIANGDKLLFESIERKAACMEADLLRDSPTALERLCVERVISTWMQTQHADAMAAIASDQITWARLLSQHQDRAHRRYQAAIKQLATIRQLLPRPARAEQAKAAKVTTAGQSDVVTESRSGFHQGEVDGDGTGAAAACGTDQQQSDEHSHGRLNGHTAKPKATDGNGAKVESSQSPGETNKPGEPDQPNGQPVNRILRFPDAPLTSAK